VPDQLPGVDRLAEALFAGGHKVGGDGIAHNAILKLKLGGVVGCRGAGKAEFRESVCTLFEW
jgi:hypothetical protein